MNMSVGDTKRLGSEAAKRRAWETKIRGSEAAKRRVWNAEYNKGEWDYLDADTAKPDENRDPIYRYLNKYCVDTSVLDLGCGAGTTALLMTDAYREYVGVDISTVAVEKARARLAQNPQRAGKVTFFASDILSFVPGRKFSTILFRESLPYFPVKQIVDLMRRYSDYLAADGVFIIRIYDKRAYREIVETLEKQLDVVEKYEPEGTLNIMAVYRPLAGATPKGSAGREQTGNAC